MARHLGEVSDEEWEGLLAALVIWLLRTNVAGSLGQDYSLYQALADERDKARLAAQQADKG